MADQGRSGGRIAQDVATRDELKQAVEGEDATPTTVKGHDKVQPHIPTRADNEGANG